MLEVTRDQSSPRIIQLSLFLPNRPGALLGVARKLEEDNIHICAISILDAADHAVIRLVVDRPSLAKKALVQSGFTVFEAEVLGVELPTEKGIGPRQVLAAILLAEVNIHYIYSLIVQCNNHPVLVLHIDDVDVSTVITVLKNHGLALVGQDEIYWED